MSGRSEVSLASEAARRRIELREARAALEEANLMLLGVFLRDRLRDPRDFDFVGGLAAVLDRRGAIVWTRVDELLTALLQDRPHLAAPEEPGPLRRGVSALEFFTAET
ncbi:hypothetical protein [Microbacterium sp. RURRCA19A]|uniref:hypothetical protein n=1 Tax=Microbacterium sp. RURRCA19A TaxID=1907391 RepID=UPI0011158A5D|nr:hypothetical protein [Microbacterium sp. RURRCA19A]